MGRIHNVIAMSHRRRGAAMLLVLVSLAMATILTVSYLASRDNSAAIGDNVIDAAKSRWASETGLEYGVAVLETESNWRTSHINGKLIDDMMVQDSSIDLDLIDLRTNTPPDADTEHVLLISTALTNGVEQMATAQVYSPTDPDHTVDVGLSEFAVFATDSVALEGNAVVALWPRATVGEDAGRIAIGTQSLAVGAVSIDTNAAAIDATVYHDDGASSFLVSDASAAPVRTEPTVDPIPVPMPPDSGVAEPGVLDLLLGLITHVATNLIQAIDARVGGILLGSSSTMTMEGDITWTTVDDLNLNGGSSIIVNGDVKMVVFGDLTIDASSIVLGPNGLLELYVRGNVLMNDAYVGEQDGVAQHDTAGYASYMDPRRLRIYDMSGSAGTWTLTGDSLLKGLLYAPRANLVMDTTSALYGSIVSQTALVRDNAAVFFDRALNNQYGYTNLGGTAYNPDGTVRSPYATLPTLGDGDVQSVASAQRDRIFVDARTFDYRDVTTPPLDGPTEPTPRTVPVENVILSVGNDVAAWEQSRTRMTAAMIEMELRSLESAIMACDPTLFAGATSFIRMSQRSSLATSVRNAADQVAAADYANARINLQSAYDRVDGDPAVQDTMLDTMTRSRFAATMNTLLQGIDHL